MKIKLNIFLINLLILVIYGNWIEKSDEDLLYVGVFVSHINNETHFVQEFANIIENHFEYFKSFGIRIGFVIFN